MPPGKPAGRHTFSPYTQTPYIMSQAIEIMDTTLRDGEQTDGVAFVPHEKLQIARKLLRDVGVDRIEVASARVSDGEHDAVSQICRWSASEGMADRVEVLGFIDRHASIDWIRSCGGRVVNLLCKGSHRHCTLQLRKTPEEHIADILGEIGYATAQGMTVNVYLEDWSNGIRDNEQYVFALVDALKDHGVRRFMLPDTLGVLDPLSAVGYFRKMRSRYPDCHFDFHAHNDYDLAIANVSAAILSGIQGIHTAVNGLGERAGNAPLSSVQAILKDHFHLQTHINEACLYAMSRLVESISGIAVPANRPIVGRNVFTQVAGVHADGDNKSGLYCNALIPERFGRQRAYALGKNSGKANIARNLQAMGLELTAEQTRRVTQHIIQLGDRKERVTPDDLPYIVADVLHHDAPEARVRLVSYLVTTAHGLQPTASIKVEIDGRPYQAQSAGDGQFDAFVRALRKIYTRRLHRPFPTLTDYNVTIPPGGRTDSFVQTLITWEMDGRTYRTSALDADQTCAAIKATIKMLNRLEDGHDTQV